MGHMRSRSSLFAHILMTDKKIFGIGESNKVYRKKMDILKMRIKTQLYGDRILPLGFMYLDQINHNKKTPNLHLIKSVSRIVILVRKPEETFESIKELSKNFYKEWSHEEIESYYIERLEFLKELKLSNMKSNLIVVDSEDLVTDTQKCLERVQSFLQLENALSSNYKLHSFTGKHGDPSKNISSGRIVRTEGKLYGKHIAKKCNDLYNSILT